MVYLIFNEGYGDRRELADEAIRLGRLLTVLMPDEPEAHGLLALMLCHDSRREARFAGDELVLLEDQDRSLWDAGKIEQGRAALDRAMALGGRGAVGSTSCRRRSPRCRPRPRSTGRRSRRSTASWPASRARRWSSSTAPSRWRRPARPRRRWRWSTRLALDDYRYLHSTRGELLRRLGRADDARAAYRRALDLTRAEPERRFLQRRLAEL